MIVPMGPPPLMVTVRLSFSPLSMAPIIEVAISVRPSAAVAVRDRPVDLAGALDQLRAFDEDGPGLTAQRDILYIPSICKTSIYGLLARKCKRFSSAPGASKV